nr:ATP-binding protein [Spirochaetales bacterium]
ASVYTKTALKNLERVDRLLEAIQDGFWDVDLKHSQVYHSKRWFNMMGFAPEDFPPNYDPWPELIHPEEREDVVAFVNKVVTEGREYYNEYRIRTKSGSYIWVAAWGKCIEKGPDGEPERVVGTHTDITDRKLAELSLQRHLAQLDDLVRIRTRELVEALEEAKAANKAKSEFLTHMSHELRTPLNGVLGISDLLLSENLDDKHKNYVSTIKKSSLSLLHLLNDILDLSRIEQGTIEPDTSTFSIAAVCNAVVQSLCSMAMEKGLELTVHVSSSVPQKVLGDGNRLEQILLNLVMNGIKFTKKGSVCIHAEPDIICRGFVVFSVSDTGVGITAEKQQYVFDRFYQVDSTLTRENGGAGLGLAICTQLVALLGGENMHLQSTPGEGSTFSFSLPLEETVLLHKADAGLQKGCCIDSFPGKKGACC